ncbi:hypothetical protein CEB3_c19790 [Peptococcaceae bacterium CEB3]|nr:hypothetical protein CEB3_c19790 [Peptococcaceae bacterium CEB3]
MLTTVTKTQGRPYPIYKDQDGQVWMANPDLTKFFGYTAKSGIKHFLLSHNGKALENSAQILVTDAYPTGVKFYPAHSIIKICEIFKARRPWVQDLAKHLKGFKTSVPYDLKGPAPAFYWNNRPVWTAKQIPGAERNLDQLTQGKDYDYVFKLELQKLHLLGHVTGLATKKLLVFFSPAFALDPKPDYKKIARDLGMVIAHSKTPAQQTIKYIIEEKGIKDPALWVKNHGYPRYIGEYHVDYTHLKLDWEQIGKDPEWRSIVTRLAKLIQEIKDALGSRHHALLMELDETYGELAAAEAEAAYRQGKETA